MLQAWMRDAEYPQPGNPDIGSEFKPNDQRRSAR